MNKNNIKKKEFDVKSNCISCWACVGIAPEIFEFNEENKSCVKRQPETEKELQDTEDAKNICPVDAIIYKNEDNKN